MGFWDDLTGNTAADAARAAAAKTYAKQQEATGAIRSYGDTLPGIYNSLAAGYDPSNPTGTGTGGALSRLIQDPSSVRSLPGYEFAQSEGIRALDHSAAARGMLNSGRNEKDVLRFSQGLADQTYGNQLSRLMGLKQAQTGVIDRGIQGQLGTRTAGFNGDMASAGTLGQGDIAAANAQAAGTQNLFNAGLNLGGKILGGLTGGGLGSLFGGGGMGGSSYNPAKLGSLY